MNKKALIAGVAEQEGDYLAEFLLQNDYVVHDAKRRLSLFMRKLLDVSRISEREWAASTSLKDEIKLTYKAFGGNQA